MIFYFSATGNSKYVAEKIAERFGDKAVSIERYDFETVLSDGEMFGIVAPVHFWQLALVVREFLQNINIKCSGDTYSFIVTTYGTTPGCTFSDARKILSEKGVELKAGFSVPMPDNWTPIFDLSNPEKVKAKNEKADIILEKVIEDISNKKTGNRMKRKTPYFVRKFSNPTFERQRKTENFYVEDECIACGLCANKCPVNAIEIKDKRAVWVKDECALCFRCVHCCPTFSIQYANGKTKLHGQYTHPKTKI